MNENKHTPEPWSVDPDSTDYYASILDADGADTILLGDYGDWWMTKANARRIVACVNACAGIETGHLEKYGLPDLAQKISDLRKQRDELLKALERFMDSHEECTDFDGFAAQIVSMADYHQAQEAIASVKGKQ